MFAYEINALNLVLIRSVNDNVTPNIEDETHYFITDDAGYNAIITEAEFKEKYTIRHSNEAFGRYLINKK